MVKRLKLENFRGVKKGEIELGDLTILVGSNNSAKTTILEALFLLPNPFRSVPYMIPAPTLPIISTDVSQKTSSTELTAASLVHEMHKTLNSQGYVFLLYNYIAEEATIEWDDGNYLKFVTSGRTIYATTNIPSFQGTMNPTSNGVIYPFGWLYLSDGRGEGYGGFQEKLLIPESLLISSEFTEFSYLYMYNNWANIFNLGIAKEVAQEISHMVSENFVNITIEPFVGGNFSIFGFLKDGRRIRLGDLGSGAQIYIVSRMLYELKKPKILLWDDIEAHLNPRMLVRIGEWFSELIEDGVQVVVSTHSLETVRILVELNKNAIICLTSLEDGVLKQRGITIKEVDDFLSAGIDVRLADSMIL